jgi:hypothetical protein
MSESRFQDAHILMGRSLLLTGAESHLEDNAALWSELWAQARGELLPQWIREFPGTRPPAWWLFDDHEDDRHEDESETEYLSRLGEIGADELNAIRVKAVKLAAYNRGRETNRCEAGPVERFAANSGLLTAGDAAEL